MRKKIKKGISVVLSAAIIFSMCICGLSNAYAISYDRQEFSNHYYQVVDQGLTWTEAQAYCEKLGGHLVTITSQQEQSFVETLIKDSPLNVYWIGLYFTEDFVEHWVTGETYEYSNWASQVGEPNHDLPGELYTHIYARDHIWSSPLQTFGQWSDIRNDGVVQDTADVEFYLLKNSGFICEWDSCKHEDKNSDCVCDYCKSELHDSTKIILGKPATCTATGLTDGIECADCGETLTAQTTIPMTNHIPETVPGKPATCTATGLTEGSKCADCDTTLVEQMVIPATGHHDTSNGVCDKCGTKLTNCNHLCHKSGFIGFIWIIVQFFWRIFKMNPTCSCGAAHY